MNIEEKEILFIFGLGGHEAQMKRIIGKVNEKNIRVKKICLCEEKCDVEVYDKVYFTDSMRDKYQKKIISFDKFLSMITLAFLTFRIIKENRKIIGIVSTGPGIAIIPSIIFRTLGKKVVFIETWSRFYSKSLTGRFMEKFSTKLIVQNIELKNLYKNAIYGGRL